MPAPPPSPEHERRLLRALQAEWSGLNAELLGGALRPPVIGLSDGERHLGRWHRAARGIEIARPLVAERPWGEVRAVLAHEMAHQYADEVLRATDETAHGQAFRRTCARMGISPEASGSPSRGEPEPRALRLVRKLLALADSPNEHEARLAAARARRLMLEHNLEAHALGSPARYAFRQVGAVKARFQAHEKWLAGLLSKHFFVECLWMRGYDARTGRPGRYLEISGTRENLDMAEWAHAFLTQTGERLWEEHRRASDLTGDGERRRFLAGVVLGFDQQLEGQRCQDQREGLVWLGDQKLKDFFAGCHPRVRSRRGPRVRAADALREGEAAGRRIVLRKPVAADPARRSRRLEAR